MFYGQNKEDEYLSHFFNNNYKGVCIDIGCFDGITWNNTLYFENKGWYSLCIEPIPEYFTICNSVRNHTINCCVLNHDKHNAEKISLQAKSLNTIFQEENISKNIDFISIISEYAEIDVLKGINFNNYNVNFFIIENIFNTNVIENYLNTQNFKKLHRLSVNDFYVNNNYLNILIHGYFKITQATYYNIEKEKLGNVTDIVNILLQRYTRHYTNDIIVSNTIFGETLPYVKKRLFITINNIKTNDDVKFMFDEFQILDFHFIFNDLHKYISN